jgi:zinc resistance-associated protein
MRKKVTMILGIGLLVAALAVPVTVLAHGWGGRHMMGNWGTGPGSISPEQKTQLEQLDRRFYDETVELRKNLWNKSTELNTVLSTTDPDREKVKTLNKEVNDLRAKLDEKSLNYELEVRKIAPELRFGGGYGRSHGYHMGGFGTGMMGGDFGPGMMARGPGNWNCAY